MSTENTETVISINHVSKVYKLFEKPMDRLKESLSLTHKNYHTDHFALEDISLEVHKGECVGIIGTNGSGKSTLVNEVEKRLVAQGRHTMALDGDNIRLGLNRNLGFAEQDRIENIRRISEVAKLMNDAGLIVLTSFISPYTRDRQSAKEIIGEKDFIEIYVSTPLEECEKRDVKGLYKRARTGEIPNFTGISSPYEPPVSPDITIDTTGFESAIFQISPTPRRWS